MYIINLFKDFSFTILLVICIIILITSIAEVEQKSVTVKQQIKDTLEQIIYYKKRRMILLQQPIVKGIFVQCDEGYVGVVTYDVDTEALMLRTIGGHE